MTPDTCLNLILPAGLEDAVGDLLLSHPEIQVNFASFPVHAHGANVPLAGAAELVSGHADRVQMELLLARSDAEAVLGYLRQSLPNPHIFFWMSPVLMVGRME